MNTLDFIKQVADGDGVGAKDTLNNILSGVAFESLSNKKQEIAKNIFNSPVVEEDIEQLDEISKKTLGSYIKKATDDIATKAAGTSRYAERSHVAKEKQDYESARKNMNISDKLFDKNWKRKQNVAKAVDKLTKED